MKKLLRRAISTMLVFAMVITICPQMKIIDISAAQSNAPYCISEGRPSYVSSGENENFAVDGDLTTRWQASNDDTNEWFYVDLGKKADIDHIFIKWEAAYAKSYEIQFSDDETNWRTVYTKGKGAGIDGETVSQVMTVSRGDFSTKNDKTVTTLSWSELDGVSYYYIYLDDISDKTPATAADGYPFNGNWGTRTSCEVWIREGNHTYTVVAYDENDGEIARASMEIDTADIEEETTTVPSGEVVDPTEHTISFDELSVQEKQARYVKIIMTERQLEAYGCSFFEFQVYGDNGLVEKPADYGTNLALGKQVKCSGIRDEWWMYDENGVIRPDAVNNVKAENAVDGNLKTSFTSYQGDNQWIYVDLGQAYTLGRVVIDWNADAGKIYDVDVSTDGKSWTTVHRVLRGYTELEDNFTFYKQNVRYVRVFGYTKVESGSGFGINELQVYEYVEGDSKENEAIQDLPTRQIINNPNGKGSYVSGEMYNEKNKLPTFVNEENIEVPIDSNSWWSSALVKTFSNLLCVTPLKSKFSTKGLGVLTATAGWVGTRGINDLGTDQSTETGIDFYVMPDGYNSSKGYDRVENYGDYSVELGLMDNKGMQMKTTFVKGSPYLFNEFCGNTTVFINSSSITEIFDANGNAILTEAGQEVIADHIGFTTVDDENTKAKNEGSYYCINVPAGTTFKAMVVGSKETIKVTLPSADEDYMSIAAMTSKDQIDTYYQHGYAFVTDTYVGYTYDENTSKVVTSYEVTTKLMRNGFSNVTMQAMFPHQWKNTTDDQNAYTTYPSIRGDMKAIWSNTYTTTQQFSGLLPTFALPESDMFNSAEMIEYLNAVVASKINTAPVDDAYWEGKNVHPLAISIVMADQLGETEIKQKLLKKLKSIMEDWFTYDGGDDKCYLIYNKDWGTVYYPNSAYGANAAICDHNFTYGYFAYGAAVLATYDKQFLKDYKDMVEILIRDYANPLESEEDGMFCKFRSFDQYSGHAWAGGYADNDSGNNQESASEALFAWVGMYLWGEVTQNQTYIDAAAYGFTTEMESVLQYWFDYDETNWLEEFPFEGVGQIYGASMGYGTYFGGQPTYIYGIQWLPISEYLTNYGMNQEKCAKVYAGLEYDTQYAIDIETRLAAERGETYDPNSYVTPDNGWQHITWPFLSQTDPERAYEKFSTNVTKVQTEDRANTLWFIAAMDQLGYRTKEYTITGDIQGSVYYNDDTQKYTAQVWNPTDTTQTVTIKDANGAIKGTANVGARGLVSFNIDTENNFALSQVATPTMKATSLAGGSVQENLSGEVTYDDTQIVELACAEPGATIYYTTDGTTPTTESAVYSDRILVSSDTTVKAIAIKDGYINSAYAATAFVIKGDTIQSSDNLALGKTATASSEDGGKIASNAIDGNTGNMWQASTDTDADSQWIQVDLGSVQAVNTVTINWETAYAAKYQIQVSTDGENWTTVDEVNGLVGEVTSTFAATKARYVRMQGISRGTQYGYGIHEIEVYGAVQAKAPTITPVSGTYDGVQTVTMSTAVKGAEIKYTTDGSDPTEDSPTYTEPITVSKSCIVKAITYRKGMVLSDVTESSIIISGTISLNKTSATIAIDRTVQLVAMTDETVTWTSSDKSVATVDANGLVTGKAVGNATITAKTEGGVEVTCEVNVTEPVHITSIVIKPAILEMKNKTSETLEVVITPAATTDDTTITWTSSDEDILVVNENGTITAKNEGDAIVTAKIGNFTATCKVIVGPAATIEEMILSSKYNAALNKKTTVMPSIQESSGAVREKVLTDGNITTGHIATTFGTAGTYIEIDLGQTYDASGIDQIVSVYKEESDGDTPVKGYEIQYSANGVDYTTVKNVDGPTAKEAWINNNLTDIQTVSATGAVRYVRLVYPDAYTWGIQAREVAVLSTEQNLKTVEVEQCADPADLTVSSDKICEITYTITAGVGQDGYKYIVYLDGTKVADRVDAGTYTLTGIEAGTHTVKVISYYDQKTSAGISKEVTVDDGSLKDYVGSERNLSLGATVTVDAIEAVQQEGSKDPATLVDGKISQNTADVVETTWGSKTATIIIDLGKQVEKNSIDEVLLAFKADNTNATDYTIEFSDNETDYEEVIAVTDAAYKEALEHKFDPTTYSKDTVQYVRINITDGNANWGYQISEIAVMGGEEFMPVEPEGLVATSTSYNTITVTWTGADNGQIYFVYIDGVLKDMNLAAAGTYAYSGIDGGEHTVKVTSKLYGIESKGVTATVIVEEAPIATPVPTQKPDATTNDKDTTTNSPVGTTNSPDATTNSPVETTNSPDATDVVPTTTVKETPTDTTEQKVVTHTIKEQTVKVTVKKTKIKKATKKKGAKKAKISLKKVKGASGYVVKISTSKKFKGKKKTITNRVKKATFVIKSKKLKKNKKYYVKARAFKKVNGVIYYGKWSKRKSIKVKK